MRYSLFLRELPQILSPFPSLPYPGRLPSAIGSLGNLRRLLLNDNMLEGRLPERIGRLAVMQELILANNNFEGQLPDR
jgi:hypothetical protein